MNMGGVKTLTALLHSPEPQLVYEAATALSYIVSDSEENKAAIVADHGLVSFSNVPSSTFYNISNIRLKYLFAVLELPYVSYEKFKLFLEVQQL